jgi:single-strand DNA-binding protein
MEDSMTNIVVIQGRLTRPPELRMTQSNKAVTSFTLANDTGFGDRKKTSFLDCVAWEKLAENISKMCDKGTMINVTGELGVREWTDKNDNKRKTVEITVRDFSFCESKNTSEMRSSRPFADPVSGSHNPADFEEISDEDPELPF